jgi:hypothetical protein
MTVKFTDKFRAGLNKRKDLTLSLPDKRILYQFILANQDSYFDYACIIRRELCSERSTTLDAVIHELNDKARHDNPVKAATFAANRKTQSAHQSDTDTNNQNNRDYPQKGGGYGRGRGRGGTNTNKSSEKPCQIFVMRVSKLHEKASQPANSRLYFG